MRETIRIAIDGSHAVGKTTLLEELRRRTRIHGITFLEEFARPVARGFGVFRQPDWGLLFADRSRHLAFFQEICKVQMLEERIAGRFIVDGSLLRNLAYAKAFGFECEQVFEDWHEIRYDFVFYCSICGEPTPDGFRYSEKQMEVDSILRGLLAADQISHLVLLPDALEARVRSIERSLEEFSA